LYIDSAITSVMRLFRAFTPRALARPIIIIVEIVRNDAARKDNRQHADTDQPVFHAYLHRAKLFLEPIRTVV
jgi:hypothetical protein